MSANRSNIVVIDDDRDAVEALTEMLAYEGYDARGYWSARDGLRAALASPPQVLISDLDLPELDGLAVARAVRQRLGSATVLVAFSGWTTADYVRRSAEAGFDHFVPKTRPDELLAIVARAAAPRPKLVA